MIHNICGNDLVRRLREAKNHRPRRQPDATHRANIHHACGVLFIVISLFSIACSKRVVHDQARTTAPSGIININTATVEDLEKLPNIGRKTAQSIVEFRTANGPFRRVEHLMQIRGISEERFIELRPYIKTE